MQKQRVEEVLKRIQALIEGDQNCAPIFAEEIDNVLAKLADAGGRSTQYAFDVLNRFKIDLRKHPEKVATVVQNMREMLTDELVDPLNMSIETMLDVIALEDTFGTEQQADPRGDFRDGNWSIWHVQDLDDRNAGMVRREAPDWAWELIDETLLLDMESSAFDAELRQKIKRAYEAMEDVS